MHGELSCLMSTLHLKQSVEYVFSGDENLKCLNAESETDVHAQRQCRSTCQYIGFITVCDGEQMIPWTAVVLFTRLHTDTAVNLVTVESTGAKEMIPRKFDKVSGTKLLQKKSNVESS